MKPNARFYANRDFRIGLSHAIDRAEIIDLVFLGAGEPWQVAPLPDSPYHNETLATQFTAFDPALANEHLDRAGLTERDPDGLRLGPDGQPVRVRITVRNDLDEVIEALELVKGHWAAVGITLDLDVVERSLFRTRTRANEHDAAADNAEGGGKDFFLIADNWFPSDPASYWGFGWYQWFDGETEGGALEPSDTVKQAHALWYEATATLDPATRSAKAAALLDIVAAEFWQIGIARPTEGYGIARTGLLNVPDRIIDSFAMGAPGPARPEQFSFIN
jgi:peptide/nickel transport system substrate-binding protein